MACIHLKQLYQLCLDHDLKLGGTDLIRVVCRQCGQQEVCPSALIEGGDRDSQPTAVDWQGQRSDDSAV